MNDALFYENGLLFECTGCGECCRIHGDHAVVYMTPENIAEMADWLGMSQDAFYRAHCTKDEYGDVVLTLPGGCCNFLKNNKCSVYPVRPAQCRAWPILTEHLNEAVWFGVLPKICPGIGRGKRYSKEELEAIAKQRDDAHGRS